MSGEVFFETDYVKISWDAELKAVFSVWSGYVGGGEGKVQTGYAKVSELAAQKKSHRWLSDIRNLRVVDPADQAWIATEGHTGMVRAGIRYIAAVMPQSPTAKSSVNRVVSKMAEMQIDFASFSDMNEARAWLADQAD